MLKMRETLKEIFVTNLGVNKGERILVFTDKSLNPNEDNLNRKSLIEITELAAEIGLGLGFNLEYCLYPETHSHGAEPPEEIWVKAYGKTIVTKLRSKGFFDKLLKKQADTTVLTMAEEVISTNYKDAVDVIIALSNFSTSHTRFRDFLTRVCGTRYASMPMFDVNMLDGAMSVDWIGLERKSIIIADAVNKAVTVKIMTPNGTDMTISKGERTAHADTGILRTKGSFGNLPAGEVYFAPMEGKSFGTMILDWAPDRRLKSQIKLTVRDGNVTDIKGEDEYANVLRKKLSERSENSNIAELGIGTNDHAIHPENILEAEKIAGTIHIALGDNSSFGGVVKTPFHQDFIFFKPTVTLIDKNKGETVLIKDGEF